MRQRFAILVAVALSCPAFGGVRKFQTTPPSEPVAAAESAALFVGVRDFADDETLTKVQYAVDDAIDLAYVMAMEREPALVVPKRVLLALAGEPQKERSKELLRELRAAGARVMPARKTDVVKLLEQQSAAVGARGLLIVSFATHGTNDGGTQHLLTADSLVRHADTCLTEAKIREIVTQAKVPRALILIDACRERLTRDVRSGNASPRSAAAMLEDLGRFAGQVVFSAAAANQYAYDDDERANGVFTAAVIDALRCEAATNEKGYVTVDTLQRFVEENVRTWIQKHRHLDVRHATQIAFEGQADAMPLTVCLK